MSAWQPRQRRAAETRRRIQEAALTEMERVGVDAARVADIVAAAGVGWGSFYRYFASKEDVLLESAATVAQVFADFCDVGTASGRPAAEVIVGAFWRAANSAPTAVPLWEATFRALAERPERLSELLALRRVPSPFEALAAAIDRGQRDGELRDDYPAPLLANVILTSVWANALREGPVAVISTRLPPPGSGVRASQRILVAQLMVDSLRRPEPAASETARPALPDRIGRKRSRAVPADEGKPNRTSPTRGPSGAGGPTDESPATPPVGADAGRPSP